MNKHPIDATFKIPHFTSIIWWQRSLGGGDKLHMVALLTESEFVAIGYGNGKMYRCAY